LRSAGFPMPRKAARGKGRPGFPRLSPRPARAKSRPFSMDWIAESKIRNNHVCFLFQLWQLVISWESKGRDGDHRIPSADRAACIARIGMRVAKPGECTG